MKVHEYREMMRYLTTPSKPEYQEVADKNFNPKTDSVVEDVEKETLDVMPYGDPWNQGDLDYPMPIIEGSEPSPFMREEIATGGRVGFAAGGFAKMIEFILKNKNRINELYSVTADQITPEFLEKIFKQRPQTIQKMYNDMLKLIGVKKGEAPKTDIKKVTAKVEADQKNIKELAENNQIPVKEIGEDILDISDSEVSKAYKDAFEGNDLDLSDNKYDAQIIAEYLSNNLYKTEFYDLPQNAQIDLYDKAYTWLMDDKMEKAMRAANPMKGPIDTKTGKNIITGEKVMDVPEDEGMFDNVFEKMFPDYTEGGKYELPLPGEEPLTKKKRILNAEGGVIGEDGMFVGEDMGSRMGFKKYVKVADRPGNEKNLTTEKLIEYIKNNPGKSYSQHAKDLNKKGFKTIQGNKFTEQNISVRLSTTGETYLGSKRKAYKTDKDLIKNIRNYFNEEIKAGREVSRADIINKFFPEVVEQYGTTSGTSAKTPVLKAALGKNYKKLIFKGEQYEAKQKIKNIIQEVVDNKRPIIHLSSSILKEETGASERTISDVLNKNKTYVKNVRPKLRSVAVRAPYNEEFQTVKVKDFDNLTKKFPKKISRPGSKQDFILQSMVRHAAQNGEKYKIISGDNFNNYKIKDNETGEILTRKNIIEKIKNKDPKYSEISNVYDELQLYKKTPFIDPITKKKTNLMAALRKATGIDNPLHVHHMKGVKTDPLNNLQVATYKANLGAKMAKSTEDLKILGIRGIQEGGKNITGAPGFNIEQNIERFSKFANRKILSDAASGFQKIKTPTQTFLEKRELKIPTTEILQDVVRGQKLAANPLADMARVALPILPALFGPSGVAAMTYGFRPEGGYDLSKPEDRFTFETEAALAPATVKGTSKAASYLAGGNQTLRRGLERGINLLARAPIALKFARALSPLGLLSLAGEAGYFTYQKAKETQAAIDAMTPHQRELYESQMQGEALGTELGFATGGRVGLKDGDRPDKPIIPINPLEPEDPSRRDFMKKGAGLGALGAAVGTGLIKFAPEIAKGVKNLTAEVPQIIKELYTMILKKGLNAETRGGRDFIMGDPPVKSKRLGNFELHEGPEGITITRTIDNGDLGYKQEAFQLRQDENGKLFYEEATVRPDYEGKLKDVESGVDLDTYQEIGTFLSKVSKDDKYYGIAKKDIQKAIEEMEAAKTKLD